MMCTYKLYSSENDVYTYNNTSSKRINNVKQKQLIISAENKGPGTNESVIWRIDF